MNIMSTTTWKEVHVSQFTSSTTCYSGLRRTTSRRFATETHTFLLGHDPNENVQVTAAPLPLTGISVSSSPVCVGYDACQEPSHKLWELFAFLEERQVLEQQQGNTTATTATTSSDPQHTSTTTTSTSSETIQTSSNNMSNSSLSFIHAAEEVSIAQDGSPSHGWLVLRHAWDGLAYKTVLTFRPLAPHVGAIVVEVPHIPTTSSTDESPLKEQSRLVWVGSADDSKLRCYLAVEDIENKLYPLDLLHSIDAFSFSSHVMSIDSIVYKDQNFLAIGCQDGTVRLVSFELLGRSFRNVKEHTVIVDGPILSLSLMETTDEMLQLAVGSMCGFVCRLQYNGTKWHGPTMVTDGLWNNKLQIDDPVLAVDMRDHHTAAVGTQAGRCLLYEQQQGEEDDDYRLVWQCQLPFPIHAIVWTADSLLVTTQWTIHVFQLSEQPAVYSASTAKRRLEALLEERKLQSSPTERAEGKDPGVDASGAMAAVENQLTTLLLRSTSK